MWAGDHTFVGEPGPGRDVIAISWASKMRTTFSRACRCAAMGPDQACKQPLHTSLVWVSSVSNAKRPLSLKSGYRGGGDLGGDARELHQRRWCKVVELVEYSQGGCVTTPFGSLRAIRKW